MTRISVEMMSFIFCDIACQLNPRLKTSFTTRRATSNEPARNLDSSKTTLEDLELVASNHALQVLESLARIIC